MGPERKGWFQTLLRDVRYLFYQSLRRTLSDFPLSRQATFPYQGKEHSRFILYFNSKLQRFPCSPVGLSFGVLPLEGEGGPAMGPERKGWFQTLLRDVRYLFCHDPRLTLSDFPLSRQATFPCQGKERSAIHPILQF
ncbi:hypothetical protein [Ulvibacterium marinum]|uniref:hypothetical protein n=1 Tax=Ulvibacterium marinum TaxID=2419782 RepID=UPI002495614E|nr:hypothetical protein [Ulvibacterium marinum]